MNKSELSILLIDKKMKEGENIVKNVFTKYGRNYGLLMFPPDSTDQEIRIQIVFFNYNLLNDMEKLFHINIDYDPDDLPNFFDFDLTEIEEDVFYEILDNKYSLSIKKLTEIEK